MGLVSHTVKFSYPAPRPEAIAAMVTEISGLQVKIREVSDLIYREFNVAFSFDGYPHDEVKACAYQMGAVKALDDERESRTGYPSVMRSQGYNDRDGAQSIYLRFGMEQEPTLFFLVSIALERLGGVSKDASDDELLAEYGRKISPDELKARHARIRREQRKMAPFKILYAVALLLWLPFLVLWTVVSMPWRLYKVWRVHPEYFRGGRKR